MAKGGRCGKGECVEKGACMAKGGVRGKRGVCVVKGGMHGKGGHAWQKGACVVCTPPPLLRDTAGQCAGGTHPTGMHSCSQCFQNIKVLTFFNIQFGIL